ncbi:hypothetical protein LTR95_017123 [Oleoguttula sp. CCFEE 5521]
MTANGCGAHKYTNSGAKESADGRRQLREVPDRTKCPVSLLFALCFARGAFATISCPDDLNKIPTPDQGCAPHNLLLKPEMLKAPVFQALEREGGYKSFSASKMWDAGSLSNLVKELGYRAGYEEPVLPYSFRRGFANAIDKEVPEAVRKKLLGHTQITTHMVYASQVIGVDLIAIMNGTAQNLALTKFLSCMRPVARLSAERGNLLARPHNETRVPLSNAARRFDSTVPRPTTVPHQAAESTQQGIAQSYSGRITRLGPSREMQTLLKHDTPRSKVIELIERSGEGENVPLGGMIMAYLALARSDAQLSYLGAPPGESHSNAQSVITDRTQSAIARDTTCTSLSVQA